MYDLASPCFSDCMGCLTENRFCDTQYRINCDPSFVFFENNWPYILQYPTRVMNFELKYTINNWNEDTVVSCEIDGKI